MTGNFFITLPYKLERAAPPFEGNDICYPASLVRHFLDLYTKRGSRVFDPFVGLGTTLFVAEEMGRIPYGIEAERERFEWVAGQMTHWNHVFHDDAANCAKLELPKMDFCMTSPPYMPRDHRWNPLYSGDPSQAGYDNYRRRMKYIFGQIHTCMKRGAIVVVQVDNLRRGKCFTPLVHDIGAAVGASFRMMDEKIIRWENGPADYPLTHCLVFKKV